MVLDATYGAGTSISGTPTGTWGKATTAEKDASVAALKKAFESIYTGDRVTFQKRGKTGDNDQHAIIVAGKGGDNVTVYDCNYTGTDKIGYYTVSYSTLIDRYDRIRSGVHHK